MWTDVDETEYRRAQGRIARWEDRKAHKEQGGKTLSLERLENLIIRTQLAAMVTESEIALAVILLRIEDMEREWLWRSWLEQDDTDWPEEGS